MKILFSLIAMLFLTQTAHAITYAQMALGGGYTTVVMVHNRTAAEFKAVFYLRTGNGQKWPGSWTVNGVDGAGQSGFTFPISPRGTFPLIFTSSGETQSGYLEIFGQTGYSTSNLTTTLFYQFHVKGVLWSTTGGGESQWGTTFSVPVEQSAAVWTGIAYCPWITTSAFPITLQLYDYMGNLREEKTIIYNGHSALFLWELFDNMPTDFFVGAVRVKSLQSIYMTCLRMEITSDGRFLFTSTPLGTGSFQ